ncbi:MAG: HAMP domain-containing sensor histidine kinase, partial [Serratia marcescens]|nr:HAMP domain-containing sensor histidine kinase [Serratia marcescens]
LADTPQPLETVDLSQIIHSVIDAHALTARAKLMQTHVELEAATCRAEPVLLTRVIDNLYSNAVYYGSESGTIWFRTQTHGNRVWIDVANTGTPIPEAEQTMIFEPFFQGRQQRKGAVKGSGLGLSIAKDCLRRMQGDLHFIHTEEADVCFRIELNLSVGK